MSCSVRVGPWILAVFSVLVTPWITGCGVSSPRFTRDQTVAVAHVSGSALEVVNANGSVTAERHPRADVRIEARLHSDKAARLEGAKLMAERLNDGLRIWVEWPDGQRRPREGADLRIYLPDSRGVNIRSSNGALRVVGLHGEAELATSNGPITVQGHDGSVACETSNGPVRLEEITGPVSLRTSNASVSVALANWNPGPVTAHASNGSITMRAGTAFAGTLRMKTSNGSVSIEGMSDEELRAVGGLGGTGGGWLEVRIDGSEASSVLETSNGPIRVRGIGPLVVRE